MSIINSLFSAFSMYSRIPVPQVEWNEKNHRWSLCFFPLIGAVIGAAEILWFYLCFQFGFGGFIKGAVAAAVPLIITGGIHADGFCDVTDASASCADRQRKLEIMSDPHIGAFAIIFFALYLLVQAALFSEIGSLSYVLIAAAGFVLSRSLSGIAAVSFRAAKKTGTLQSFSAPAHRKATLAVLIITALASCGFMIYTDIITGAICTVCAAGCFLYYRLMSYRKFGGITGDLAGWFLQMCEIVLLCGVFIGSVLKGIII